MRPAIERSGWDARAAGLLNAVFDAGAGFEDAGLFNLVMAGLFRRDVPARGGTRDAMASFVAFRGHKPNDHFLLCARGLNAEPAA